VDFFRGVALWWIFMDHIPANWLAQFSLRNFALCDATEMFVLLAGYAAGIAYGNSYRRTGWLYAGADVMRRAWTLYIAHIFLFVVFVAQVSYSATALDRSEYLDEIHLDVLAEAPYRAMLEALLLTFQPAYLNILPMYIVLLVLFALVLPLIKRPTVLLALSAALYAVTRLKGWNLPSWTEGGWYFNPLAWQFLFVIGVVLSQKPPRVAIDRRVVDVGAVIVVLTGLFLVWFVWPSDDVSARVPRILARALLTVDKEGLHPMRLLSILALTWLVVRTIPIDARWLHRWFAWPFILCGQHSLPVFCSGIALSFLGRLAMEEQGGGWPVQTAVNLLGPLALVSVAMLVTWYRTKGRRLRAEADAGPGLPLASRSGNEKVT
jgi:hypothetical protein